MSDVQLLRCGVFPAARRRPWVLVVVASARSLALLFLLSPLVVGCARTVSERGVEPVWRALPTSALVRGATTRAELLEHLGPPSQVITRAGGDIYYYLHEETRTNGLVLVVYNRIETLTRYDRAIFFFDADGVLEEFSINSALERAR